MFIRKVFKEPLQYLRGTVLYVKVLQKEMKEVNTDISSFSITCHFEGFRKFDRNELKYICMPASYQISDGQTVQLLGTVTVQFLLHSIVISNKYK